jgi:hypothetical protein
MKEVAKTDQARFEWWLQSKFNILPTDPRYMDLTQEQIDLIYEHYIIDNPPKKSAYTDADYEKEEAKNAEYNAQQSKDEGRLPLQDHERFDDPDFDAEWDAEDEISPSDNVGENQPEQEFEMLGEGSNNDIKKGIDLHKTNEWEEV